MSASFQNPDLPATDTPLVSPEANEASPAAQISPPPCTPIQAYDEAIEASDNFEQCLKSDTLSARKLLIMRISVIELLDFAMEFPMDSEQSTHLRKRLTMHCSYAVTDLQATHSHTHLQQALHYQKLALAHNEYACEESCLNDKPQKDYLHWLSNCAYGYRNLSIIYKRLGKDIDRLEPAEKAISYFKYLIEVSEAYLKLGDPTFKRLNPEHLRRNCATQMSCLAEDYRDMCAPLTDRASTKVIALLARGFEHAADGIYMFDKLAKGASSIEEKFLYKAERDKLIQIATGFYRALNDHNRHAPEYE